MDSWGAESASGHVLCSLLPENAAAADSFLMIPNPGPVPVHAASHGLSPRFAPSPAFSGDDYAALAPDPGPPPVFSSLACLPPPHPAAAFGLPLSSESLGLHTPATSAGLVPFGGSLTAPAQLRSRDPRLALAAGAELSFGGGAAAGPSTAPYGRFPAMPSRLGPLATGSAEAMPRVSAESGLAS